MGRLDTRYGHWASGRAGGSPSPAQYRPASILTAKAALIALSLLHCFSATAWADCLELPYADVRALETVSLEDPNRALEDIRRLLTAVQGSPESTAAPAIDTHHLAAVYEVQAQSYSLLELDADARAAAAAGLELLSDPKDAVYVLLQTVQAENVYDPEGIDKALGELRKARAIQTPDSRADVCLQISQGRLQYRRGQINAALLTLTRAYRASTVLNASETQVEAAAALSPVMRVEGDFQQALALNQEAIDWQERRNARLSLSVSRYLRGQILIEMHDYERAIVQTQQARQLSVELKDEQGVGFADLALCDATFELGKFEEARSSCNNALRIFSASGSADVVRKSQTQLARLDLAEGHASRALSALNDVLTNNGGDVQPRILPEIYRMRAEANSALHKFADAYSDLSRYLELHSAQVDDERARQVASLRARFETDREIARNETLRRQLELTRERTQRQRTQLRLVVAAISASGVVIALLSYMLVANVRYRKRLIQIAGTDSLTGLPNRGSMAAAATRALEEAAASPQPLSLALIDLDRFKMLNDRFGHATGDRVLKEFAQISRASLRPGDAVGRWGGEEFLILLPATSLDVALRTLDTLRVNIAQIRLSDPDLRVTISAGLATGEGTNLLDEVLARADTALYEAKNSGRDLVCYSQESFETASTAVRRTLRQR